MMPNWVGFAIAGVGLLNTLLMGVLILGRWSQKVETPPVSIDRLTIQIEHLAKEISELRGVFEGRYVGLERRHNDDHARLRQIEKDKAVSDVEVRSLRRDLDEVRMHCGLIKKAGEVNG